MPIPPEDILCRFIRPADWSKRDNRPRPGAFKQPALSVWHIERLRAQGAVPEDLRIEHLQGCGQAHHIAGDYLALAAEASQIEGVPFQVRVEWRPNDQYVSEPWRVWADAHVQVESMEGPPDFLIEFRRLLAIRTRGSAPPD
jgi:hypothetical protein